MEIGKIIYDPPFDEDGTLTVVISDEISPTEQQFNRTNLSKKDFSEAHNYLLEYLQSGPPFTRRAVIVAAIIAYARPFKHNRGGRAGRATEKLEVDLDRLLSSEERALHKRVIDLRDRAIAHSDYDFRPTERINRELAPGEEGFSTLTAAFDVLDLEPAIQQLTALAQKLERFCMDELFRLDAELSASEVEPR